MPVQCTSVVDVGGEVDSLLLMSGFLFVGMHTPAKEGIIKVWNMATSAQADLRGHAVIPQTIVDIVVLMFCAQVLYQNHRGPGCTDVLLPATLSYVSFHDWAVLDNIARYCCTFLNKWSPNLWQRALLKNGLDVLILG
jgi:hypothetical protein